MAAKLRKKLSYANVMVTILAFIVLGGVAYGGVHLGKNSVGTKQIKNGAVTQTKISPSAQAVLKGQQGAQGPPGATNVVIRRSSLTTVGSGSTVQAVADCVGSEKAVGGGASWQEVVDHNMRLLESTPVGPAGTAPSQWGVTASNDTGADRHFQVAVVCASP
jgi:hypothetical protein